MKQKLMKAYAFLVLLFGVSAVHAQQAVISSGGKAIGVDGSVNYSLGQTTYTTNRNSAGSVSQGVQQPFEISVVSGIEVKSIQLECSIYPNPTTDFLRLKLQDIISTNLSYQLYDINGKQIISKKVEGSDTEISLQGQKSGTYFLKVLQLKGTSNQQAIKVFKIIKN
jgi:Secretion system C-terminal sorting domain